jgi:hypothetical protein
MAQDLGMLTNMWMVDPTMFDPTQASNRFSNFNNSPFPFPPTYNTGAGGPVNAATGKPIASFQQWQQQNPGGMSLNATPAAPAQPASTAGQYAPGDLLANAKVSPGAASWMQSNPMMAQIAGWQALGSPEQSMAGNTFGDPYLNMVANASGGAPKAALQQQASGPPNNWQAAINALANPGNPVTQGANVPLATGYQPAGGVNQAFLNQAGAGQGMNQNFLSALRAIQGRPQG